MATEPAAKSPSLQEQRQLDAMKEKLVALDAKQKQLDAMKPEDYPDQDILGSRERTKAGRAELSKEIKKLSK